MVTKRTKGQLEAEISKAVIKFELEYMGRGPADARTYVARDMILVRLRGILTPAEQQLIKAEGVELLKEVRAKLLESGRKLLERIIKDLAGCDVISMHSDVSTRTGERIIVFIVNADLERGFDQERKDRWPRKRSSQKT
ncbi:MAG: DUF2294 domain-containing protein [Candidatus Methylomirabilales bacterium]